MNKIEFTFDNGKTGERVHSYQDDDTVEAYERAAKKAQQLTNKEQTEIRCTAWLEDWKEPPSSGTRGSEGGHRNPRQRPTRSDRPTTETG